MVNRNWHDYKLPTALDVPADITSVPIEINDNEANSYLVPEYREPWVLPSV